MTTQDEAYDKVSQIIGDELKKALGEVIKRIVKVGNGENISIHGLDQENLQEICSEYIKKVASFDLKLEVNPVDTINKREKEFKPLILLPSGMQSNEILAPSLGINAKLVY